MSQHFLLISNPPHGEVDLVRAASAFRLSPAEVRTKANYAVPEIWLADEDRMSLDATAAELRECGFSIVVVEASELRQVPEGELVRACSFTDTGFAVQLERGRIELGYDGTVIASLCLQRAEAGPARRSSGDPLASRLSLSSMTGGSLMGIVEHGHPAPTGSVPVAFVDLFATRPDGVYRMMVSAEADGIPDVAGGPAGRLSRFLDECESRFSAATVDRRMTDMRVRQRPMVGSGSDESRRKGFSYASKGLMTLLEAIAPELRELSQAELASRLVYLTRR